MHEHVFRDGDLFSVLYTGMISIASTSTDKQGNWLATHGTSIGKTKAPLSRLKVRLAYVLLVG